MSTSVEGIEVSWEHVRDLFPLDPAVAYLNHGGFGVVPTPVRRAQQRLRDEMDANPMAFFTRGLLDRLAHTRTHLARFFGAQPDGAALVPNATAATQLTLDAVGPRAGDEIILTNQGYGATRIAVERACTLAGASVRTVALSLTATDEEIVAAMVDAVRPGRTRLAIVDQVTSPTAKLLPVARIAAALRDDDVPLFVDGAHAAGMLPVDLAGMGVDFWVGNLHKWAFAPRPTALFAVAARWRGAVRSLAASWHEADGFPVAVEFSGTLDYTAWLAAPAGLHLLRTLGPDRLRAHNADLAGYGQRVVGEALGLAPEQLPNPTGPVSMRLIPVPAAVLDEEGARDLHRRLAVEHGCEVALGHWDGGPGIRVSAQVYNRPQDYERLAAAVARILGGRRSRAA